MEQLPDTVFGSKKEKFISKEDLKKEANFLRDLEKMIEEDEKKLENEEDLYDEEYLDIITRNNSSKGLFKVLNTTSIEDETTEKLPTTKSPFFNKTFIVVKPNATNTVRFNLTEINILNSTAVTKNSTVTTTKSTKSLNESTTVGTTTKSYNLTTAESSTTEKKPNLSAKLPDIPETVDEPLPDHEEVEEEFSGEHHALVGDSAGFTQTNLFLISTLVCIALARSLSI